MSGGDLLTDGHLLVAEVDPGQRVHHLPDDVVTGEAVEAEHHKVQGNGGQLVVGEPVEGEDLVVDRVQGLSQDPRLHLVAFLRQQLQLDVGVGRAQVGVLGRQVTGAADGDDQGRLLLVVLDGEVQGAQLAQLQVVLRLFLQLLVLLATGRGGPDQRHLLDGRRRGGGGRLAGRVGLVLHVTLRLDLTRVDVGGRGARAQGLSLFRELNIGLLALLDERPALPPSLTPHTFHRGRTS